MTSHPKKTARKGNAHGLLAPLTALILAAATVSGPVAADSRHDSASSYVPIGVPHSAQANESARSNNPGRPIIINNGPVIIMPSHGQAPQHPHNPQTPTRPTVSNLPLACLQTVTVNRGDVRLMEARCLDAEGVDVRALPNRCGVALHTRNGIVRGFDPTCLGDAGYRLAGR
ncbi:hypothetical protein [Flavimaricola marinus]|uniref:Uncharacterized protein n=1 Tax=Flavimaricola marinus TaxID=1819565 RepID=A0A238LFB8_9RHOB|nr:hypothetical protein [Flavimaricola marinus]SMY08308.1 hypothetical protein LOM8899_02459 [Flavimaricola marinus]